MFRILFYFLFIPGFIYTATLGLLATWIDRKITARLQWRVGPRWFQPFADIAKLLGKEICVPEGAPKLVFISAPIIGLSAAVLVSTMLWTLNVARYSGFVGDLIVIIYLLTIPSLSMMVGASASRNPISALGASREMKLMLAYELPFLIAIATVIAKVGSIIIGNIIGFQSMHGAIIGSLSGFMAFLVSVIVIQAKLGFVPFDMAESEQELMGGICLEYSGALLALFRITKAMLLFTLPMLLITLFWGGLDISSFGGVLWFIFKYVIILTLLILIKNTNPRLRIDQAVRFFWGPVTLLAIAGLLLALIGL